MNIFSTRNVLAIGVVAVLVGAYYLSGSTLFRAPEVKAGASQNVSGWAYSMGNGSALNDGKPGIGWISFNSYDCDVDKNNFVDSTAGCGGDNATTIARDYGVNIDIPTGNFSGYAWGENARWIDFAPTSGYPGAPLHGARLESNGTVTGWARVLSATTDPQAAWDGWIKLSDAWLNGVAVSSATGKFSGYAWGDVVGWIDFAPAIAGENVVHVTTPATTCPPAPFAYSGVCNLSPADLLTCTPGATGLAGLETGTCTVDASSHDYRACSTAECPTPPPPVCDGDKICEAGETFKTCPSDCKMKFFQF